MDVSAKRRRRLDFADCLLHVKKLILLIQDLEQSFHVRYLEIVSIAQATKVSRS